MDMLSEYTARNNQALDTLINKHKAGIAIAGCSFKEINNVVDEVSAN